MNFSDRVGLEIETAAWLSKRDLWIGLILSTLTLNLLSLAFPLALLQIYDRIVPNQSLQTLNLLVLGVFTALLLETMLRAARAWVSAWADARFEHITSTHVFNKILSAQFGQFGSNGAGAQLERLTSLNTLKDFYGGQLITIYIDLPFVVVYFLLIYMLGGKVIIITLLFMIIMALYTYLSSAHVKADIRKQKNVDDHRMNFIVETLSGIHTIKALGLEAQMIRRYERLQETTSQNDYNVIMRNSSIARVNSFLTQMSVVFLVTYGCILIISGELTLGALAACTLLSGRAVQPVTKAMMLWSSMQKLYITRDRLKDILELKAESCATLPPIGNLRGDLVIENLCFRYNPEGEDVLKQINLHVPFGQSIALKGVGFSGRTTLLNVIAGLLKPTAGSFKINGHNICEHDIQSYRHQVAYLPEEGHLFEGTIMDNLTMFRGGEYIDKAIQMSKVIGLDTVIEHMQDGYYTEVGQGAVEAVPRGIKQRIAICRALIDRPPIVLFDEANSALDIQGDAVLWNALYQMKKDCILIIVTQRPSTMKLADVVYVLDNGRISREEAND